MSAEAEFLLVAVALYLFASGLWLPLSCVVLRRSWRGRWRAATPGQYVRLREIGLVPMLPFPPDRGLASCQPPPLVVGADDSIGITTGPGDVRFIGSVGWSDLQVRGKHLVVNGHETRLSSPRVLEVFARAKKRTRPAQAVRLLWHRALSPARARREWHRWRRVSAPLAWLCPALVGAFFVALPWAYLAAEPSLVLAIAAAIWALMISIAFHLLWLARKVYPGARSALRMDALLSAIVPFHAMRALETTAVHAMAGIHPAALLLSENDAANPWLLDHLRKLDNPRPGEPGDTALAALVLPSIAPGLLEVAGDPPRRDDDPQAARWCPRCHGLFLASTSTCPDCLGLPLRSFLADQ